MPDRYYAVTPQGMSRTRDASVSLWFDVGAAGLELPPLPGLMPRRAVAFSHHSSPGRDVRRSFNS